LRIQKERGKKLKDFNKGVEESEEVKKISSDVEQFARQFDIPGQLI
jgi:glycine hydroxymethyltransferase